MNAAAQLIGTILRHDDKRTTYKLALIRAVNDVVLSFPDLQLGKDGVAIPLRRLAEYWVAYYWPFVDSNAPVMQGYPRSIGGDKFSQDIKFRSDLNALREEWEKYSGASRPSDGFLLISELRNPRTAKPYPPELRQSFDRAIAVICTSLEQPIRYAGTSTYNVFHKPRPAKEYPNAALLPGTFVEDKSVRVSTDLWLAFRELSLWIEALCIHEWSLFTERVDAVLNRGDAYTLITSRMDNRRPLRWERNQIEILMLEGESFTCPWTGKALTISRYDMDHIVPVSVYPTDELWNLVPSDSHFNKNRKKARMPTLRTMAKAEGILRGTYSSYLGSDPLREALYSDLRLRFALETSPTPKDIAQAVSRTTLAIADARSTERF